jgi:hypothetical protein
MNRAAVIEQLGQTEWVAANLSRQASCARVVIEDGYGRSAEGYLSQHQN